MSGWLKVKTEIKSPEIFRRICEVSGVNVTEVGAGSYYDLRFKGDRATLTKQGDSWRLGYDRYGAFARHFGENGGTLLRDYAREVLVENLPAQGMTLVSQETLDDGSYRLLVAVAGGE